MNEESGGTIADPWQTGDPLRMVVKRKQWPQENNPSKMRKTNGKFQWACCLGFFFIVINDCELTKKVLYVLMRGNE